MLPANLARIADRVESSDRVLDVGGWAAPLNCATHMLDVMPYETRGALVAEGYGPKPERFTADTWIRRDMCDREPWPWPDDFFDLSVCVTTLEDIRDPIWVCRELSRVSKAGYIEVPTPIAELIWNVPHGGAYLGHEHHRWIVSIEADEVRFLHKPHSIHSDWRLRVIPTWAKTLRVSDHLQGLFWEGAIDAEERVVVGHYPVDELADLVRERFHRPAAPGASLGPRQKVKWAAFRAALGAQQGVLRAIRARQQR